MKNHLYTFAFLLIIFASGQTIDCQNKSVMKPKPTEQTKNQPKYDCLTGEFKLDTIVSAIRTSPEAGAKIERETIEQRLDKLNAECRAGKLVDEAQKEIRFYQLQGCWGNPPSDADEILDRQQKELLELKKKFTVIEITCNPSGEMPF